VTLADKTALVTGAGVRVGRAIAVELGRAGMRVAVHYRSSAEGAEETVALVKAAGGDGFTVQADLAERAACRQLVHDVVARFGGLDLLVPSAASFERTPFAEVDEAVWDRTLELNLTASFVLAREAAAALATRHGSIVFVTCSSATVPYENYLPYVVSKGALRQLMKALALELAPDVRVNAVAPGTVLPPDDYSEEATARLAARIPLQRIGKPEDVADAVRYLASAAFVTGQEIVIDGGRTLA
jgi:pteridine reductase